MKVKVQFARVKQTKWPEWLLRFAFGGLVTVAAGLIAKEFGAVVGGLFLAFPGIFPAGVTLIERHEKEKKHERGEPGTQRGRSVSAVVAHGAALGSLGLMGFAALTWWLLPDHGPDAWRVLVLATLAWFALAVLAWLTRQKI